MAVIVDQRKAAAARNGDVAIALEPPADAKFGDATCNAKLAATCDVKLAAAERFAT